MIMAKKKCYISGGVEHLDIEERKKAFAVAKAFVESLGMEAVNPMENALWQAGRGETAHWREHMRVDLRDLTYCDAIYMLRGWERSKGAKLELDNASSMGCRLFIEGMPLSEEDLEWCGFVGYSSRPNRNAQ